MDEQTQKTTVEETTSKSDNSGIIRVHNTFKSFLLSKKLWMTIFGLGVLWAAYSYQLNCLYSFVIPEQIVAFSGLSRDFMATFGIILTAYLGINGAISWKHGSETVLNQAASFAETKATSVATTIEGKLADLENLKPKYIDDLDGLKNGEEQ